MPKDRFHHETRSPSKDPTCFYPAMCDVPAETLTIVTRWLWAHRQRIGTRRGRRAATVRAQAKLVLRFLRDDARLRLLAREAGIGISTAYRYLHEAIDVIAEQAPDLHEVLTRGRQQGWSHVCLDRTLVEIDRVGARAEASHHLWCAGKHRTQGGNIQIVADPSGSPSGRRRWNRAAPMTSPPPEPTASALSTTPPPPSGCRPWPTRATTALTPASSPPSKARP